MVCGARIGSLSNSPRVEAREPERPAQGDRRLAYRHRFSGAFAKLALSERGGLGNL